MALVQNPICEFGWKARDFSLKGVDGKSHGLAEDRKSTRLNSSH